MADADAYLGSLRAAYRSNDHYGIAAHLDPLDHTSVLKLQQGLAAAPHLRPSSYSSLCKTFFPDNPQFAELVAAYLLYVRDSHTAALHGDGSVQGARNAFDLFRTCYSLANNVLASQESAWFVPTLRKLASALYHLAFQADEASEDDQSAQASAAASLLTRSLGVCAAERSNVWPSKRNAVFFLANTTLRIYFQLNRLRLCDTVVQNTRDARDFLDTQYPKADRVTFAYYSGRMFLFQRRLRRAMQQLRKAFELCTSRSYKNRRLILIYLITASLPLGIFPRSELLSAFGLREQYEPLIRAVKDGDYRSCLATLNDWQQWHINKGTYLLLREKLEVICWRNLARKTLMVANHGKPQPVTGPPTLKLNILLQTAKMAFADSTLDVEDVEAMCASLLDQGYLKAYIHHSQMLVLQKGDQFGFPPVSAVRMLGDQA